MNLYFDTSIFIPLTVAEQKSAAIQNWFANCDPSGILISDWVAVEFRSALSLKLRTAQINNDTRAKAESAFRQYSADYFTTLSVDRIDFQRAASLAQEEHLKLRAGDALHLAVVERRELELATLDRNLLAAAKTIGVRAFTL